MKTTHAFSDLPGGGTYTLIDRGNTAIQWRSMVHIFVIAFAIVAILCAAKASRAADHRFAVLPAVATSTATGRMDPNETIYFEFAFPIRHQADLEKRIERIYDPNDPLYQQYLTPQEFGDDYGPSPGEYEAVAAYAERCGFTVTDRLNSRMMLGVSAPASVVGSSFGVHMMNYVAKDGRTYRAPDRDLTVDPSVSPMLLGVLGLDDYAKPHTSSTMMPASVAAKGVRIGAMRAPILSKGVRLRAAFTGFINPYGKGLTPTGIRTAYGLAGSQWTGSGQTIATIDWGDQINLADVQAWENYYGIPTGNVTIKQYGAPMVLPMPVIVPNTGSFSSATSVSFADWQSSTTGASIYYTLEPSSTFGMCLNTTGTTSGSAVTIATCNNGAAQAWGGL